MKIPKIKISEDPKILNLAELGLDFRTAVDFTNVKSAKEFSSGDNF